MASKIIILSGYGRGIAKLYEMANKIRLEIDVAALEGDKRIAASINGRVTTYAFIGRQIAIDLPTERIEKAAVAVYSGGKCLLSGASDGKCDKSALMYAAAEYDADALGEEELEDKNDKGNDDNADEELAAVDADLIAEASAEEAVEDTVTEAVAEAIIDEAEETAEAVIEPEPEENAEASTLDPQEEFSDEAAETIEGEAAEEEVENGVTESVQAEADGNESDCAANNEHEVVTAMLDNKSELADASRTESSEPFYVRVKSKLDEMFDIYPHDPALEELVYDSKWIRIPYEDDGYYVLGVISDEGAPVFICYGLPQDKMTRPDREIEDMCEWLPLDKADVSGKGYWLVYQDAMTGENIS